MSYTTGEVAKICGVTVRTVQYYDSRNVLSPSELSEGGRRLYSEQDVQKMKIICFLRDLDFSIKSIADLFEEEHPEDVLILLLDQQEKELRKELEDIQEKLEQLCFLKRGLKNLETVSVASITDIARIMKNKKQLFKMRAALVAAGLVMDAAEIAGLIWGFKTGRWMPAVLCFCAALVLGVVITKLYYRRVAYICPQCHAVFVPGFRECFFAAHTPNTRRLTCTSCGHFGYCVETAKEESAKD